MILEHIPFTVIKEDFTECQTVAGHILRFKPILTDVFNEDKNGKIETGIKFDEISHVIAEGIDTANFEVSNLTDVSEKDETDEIEFSIKKESLNIYETKRSIILFFPRVEKIFLTRKKTDSGSPILRYRSTIAINSIPKPSQS